MPKSTLEIAKPHIISFFKACDRRVWTKTQLEKALTDMRNDWDLAERIGVSEFTAYLLDETLLTRTTLTSYSKIIDRFWWGEPTIYELASSLCTTGYFSHHSAMYLNGLIACEPNTVYFNSEQKSKGAKQGSLQQASIDHAFRVSPRISNNRNTYGDREICFVNGKNTGQYGVTSRKYPEHGLIRITNVARTLVDIVVRPAYSGGVREIVNAYQNATNKVATDEIVKVLETFRHTYPYHQAIGFLMEKSGCWEDKDIDLFRAMRMDYDFYLDYKMTDAHYSKAWRLYYPAWLDNATSASG